MGICKECHFWVETPRVLYTNPIKICQITHKETSIFHSCKEFIQRK